MKKIIFALTLCSILFSCKEKEKTKNENLETQKVVASDKKHLDTKKAEQAIIGFFDQVGKTNDLAPFGFDSKSITKINSVLQFAENEASCEVEFTTGIGCTNVENLRVNFKFQKTVDDSWFLVSSDLKTYCNTPDGRKLYSGFYSEGQNKVQIQ